MQSNVKIIPRQPVYYFIVLALMLAGCNDKTAMFEQVPASETGIRFENKLPQRKLFSILYYLYFYNGGGVSVGDINNDGLPDIYFSANTRGNNKLYLNKGDFTFEDITKMAGVAGTADWCSGVTMADVNGDGLLDIYVSAISNAHGLKGHNELFINNGNLSFTESAAEYGLDFTGFTTQAAFFDYDRDGDLDCYLLNQSQKPHQNIVDTSARRKYDPDEGDRLYRNELIPASDVSSKKFTDVSATAGIYQSNLGYGLGISVGDLNNDGWEDIYIGNDFHENDYYYVNNGNGTFTESGAAHFGHYSRFSMGNDIADYNNDGHLDIITVDMLPPDEKVLKTYGSDENPDIYKLKLEKNGYQYQCSRNCLQRNDGNGSGFSETALIAGIPATDWSWCPLFADFDNDGNKDLFISSGIVKRPVDLDYIRFVSDLFVRKTLNTSDKYDQIALDKMPDGSARPYLFKGDGKTRFSDKSVEWGTGDMKGYFNGAAYADLDNDGDLDLVINQINGMAVMLKNNTPARNFISIAFEGSGANRHGVGAKAYLFHHGERQYQQLMLTRGFQSSCEPRLHFGLAAKEGVDSILIVWPDQRYEVMRNLKPNQYLKAIHQKASGVFDHAAFFGPAEPLLSPITHDLLPALEHAEDPFDDFNQQYLIPHALSTRGPRMVTADVNADGLQDFFLCGAKGQAGMLMIQQRNGSYAAADTAVFAMHRNCEDVDALFFDANGDGSPDLFVVSGGNEFTGRNPLLLDRLYINDGKGKFRIAPDAIPLIYANKSSIAAADIDNDGDTDLFVGTLAHAKAYGVPQSSHLLINDGRGRFTLADEQTIALASIGMVTAAAFADFDNNGWPDLAVAGEWMPLTVFINDKGRFTKSALAGSTGLWQSVIAEDINNDGHADLVAGNWGWNNKFCSEKDGVLRLYVSDYDKNGQMDQLLSYSVRGREFPFLAKDEVERQLPLLKKHYLRYAEYAGLEMRDAFYGWVDTIRPLLAERLGSAVCFGDGKGGFVLKDLPADLQLAPVFSFQRVDTAFPGGNLYAAGGNFYDVIPYEGRYDAQSLALFSISGDSMTALPPGACVKYKGQVRDLVWIDNAVFGRLFVIAGNNGPLAFMRYENQ